MKKQSICMQDLDNGIDYLNVENAAWHYPANDQIETKDSFMDLYNYAVKDCTPMINTLSSCLRGEVSLSKLAAVVGNKSLSTGLSVNEEKGALVPLRV